jgi:nitrate reductase gamma subunit
MAADGCDAFSACSVGEPAASGDRPPTDSSQSGSSNMDDRLLFGVLPYAALGLCLTGLAVRVFRPRSEPGAKARCKPLKGLLWGSVSWRVGLVGVLLGHLAGFLVPRSVLLWNQQPLRLVMLEATGLALGLLAALGLGLTLLAPRWCGRKSPLSMTDTLLLTLLAVSIVSGLGIAVFDRWGSSWYASVIVPYLRSLMRLSPSVGFLAEMPFLVRLHVVSAFALMAALPLTRLAALVELPAEALRRRTVRRAARLNPADAA